ncbi:hypothetical protein [Streptomyces iconiensis]|uniref:hypothetical protein n=1 Tax=Streptomyces iconiensis TaxID=1384038 RepID=UPI003D2F8827
MNAARTTSWHIELPHSPPAAPIARAVVRNALTELESGVDRETAELLVCELVTNAVEHTPDDAAVSLTVAELGEGVLVEVRDHDPRPLSGLPEEGKPQPLEELERDHTSGLPEGAEPPRRPPRRPPRSTQPSEDTTAPEPSEAPEPTEVPESAEVPGPAEVPESAEPVEVPEPVEPTEVPEPTEATAPSEPSEPSGRSGAPEAALDERESLGAASLADIPEDGRGLLLIRTLSATCGSRATRQGKTVWFTLRPES